MIVNTGAKRSVVGHAFSGAFIGFILSSAYGYSKYKNGEIDKNIAIKNTIKATIEGGIVTASAIAATNAIGDINKTPLQSTIEAVSYVGVGIAGVYGVDKILNKDIKLIKE